MSVWHLGDRVQTPNGTAGTIVCLEKPFYSGDPKNVWMAAIVRLDEDDLDAAELYRPRDIAYPYSKLVPEGSRPPMSEAMKQFAPRQIRVLKNP